MKNTRDIGLNHGLGKGDKNRSDSKAFRRGYWEIDWSRRWKFPQPDDGFRQRGRRLIKIYGVQAGKTQEPTRRVSFSVVPRSFRP